MRHLVTGGLGFMGSNFVRFMAEKYPDDAVIVYDALSYSGRRENLQGSTGRVEVLVSDILDAASLEKAVSQADVVYHFAAQTHVDRSIEDPRPFVDTNVVGTYNVLESVRRTKTRMIMISSSEVYGTALKIPMDESHPLNPQSPYAATKVAADRLCHSYIETYGLDITILRPFNNFGPRQFPEKLIPLFVIRALQGRPLPVYGDGEYSRDYTYVGDFCEAVDRAWQVETGGETVNLATGKDYRVNEIAAMVLRGLDRSVQVSHVEDRPGHVRRLLGSTEKARKVLGWKARTSFEEGLQRTIEWYVENEWWWAPLAERHLERRGLIPPAPSAQTQTGQGI